MPHPGTLDSARTLMAGNISGMPAPALEYHFYLANKASWYEPPRGAPHLYALVHPDWRDPGLIDLRRPRADSNLCGSCLCGDVLFEATTPGLLMHCHCGLCRLASSSAFASSLSVSAHDFAWKRGEQQVTHYDPSDTVDCGVAFCRRCGSPVPRRSGQHVHIPAGGLDSAPGVRAAGHMNVAAKASWFRIEDDLPQWKSSSPLLTHPLGQHAVLR